MAVRRLSLSISAELDQALRAVARSMDLEVSRVAETLLRENSVIQAAVAQARSTAPRLKKDRSVDKLLALAKVARAQWDAKVASGQVKLPP